MRQFMYYLTFVFALFSSWTSRVMAQRTEPFNYYNNLSPSVESYSMVRYGEMNHSLYTGAMEYTLPLYMYQDEDFTLPITLGYHYDGFRPAQQSGIAGYGWGLNCGGSITRDVQGFPDEHVDMDEGIYGYFYYALQSENSRGRDVINAKFQKKSITYTLNSDIFVSIMNDTPVYVDTTAIIAGYQHRYDCSPDIFHFSLPGGITGSFIMDSCGIFKVFDASIPSGEISVTTTFDPNSYYAVIPYFSFTIATGDGYEYTFGSDRSSTEYNAVFSNDDLSVTVSAWRLTCIKAPSGRTMSFTYEEDHDIQESITTTINPNVDLSAAATDFAILGSHQQATLRYNVSLTYGSRLSKIETGPRKIQFGYSVKNGVEGFSSERSSMRLSAYGAATGAGIGNVNNEQMRLASISIHSGAETVDSVSFSHVYKGNNQSAKMFLSSINSMKNGRFSFDYKDSWWPMPLNDTFATDHWGYSRSSGNGSFRGRFNLNGGSLYNQMVDNTDRMPDHEYTNRYGLTTITYPTGGYTEIEYGPNTVSRLLDREEGALPYLRDSSSFVPGGVRVELIRNVSGEYSDSTTFHYVTSYGSSEQSSGTLLYMPRYAVGLSYDYYCADLEHGENHLMNLFSECRETGYTLEGSIGSIHGGAVVGYSKVTAISSDGSRTDYIFYDYNDYPDIYPGYNDFIQRHRKTNLALHDYIGYGSGTNLRMGDLILPPTEDKSSIRGRLKKKIEYTGGRTIETDYLYSLAVTCSIRMVHNALYDFVSVNHLFSQCNLLSESIREISGGNSILKTNEFSYNSLGQIKTETTSFSGGTSRQILYRYWHETDSTYLSKQVRDIVQLTSKGNDTYITESRSMIYGNPANPNPTQIRSYKIAHPVFVSDINNVFTLGRNNGFRQTEISYDNRFRPTQVSLPGGAYINYVWDSEGLNLLSREENISGNKFTYKWKDLVGVTEIKSPSGEVSNYFYDDRYRLSTARDTKGNPLYHYFYKLKNE